MLLCALAAFAGLGLAAGAQPMSQLGTTMLIAAAHGCRFALQRQADCLRRRWPRPTGLPPPWQRRPLWIPYPWRPPAAWNDLIVCCNEVVF